MELDELLADLRKRFEKTIETNKASGAYKSTSDWQLDSETGHPSTPTTQEKKFLSDQYNMLVNAYLQEKEQFDQLAPSHDSNEKFDQSRQRYVRLLNEIELWCPELSHLERPH